MEVTQPLLSNSNSKSSIKKDNNIFTDNVVFTKNGILWSLLACICLLFLLHHNTTQIQIKTDLPSSLNCSTFYFNQFVDHFTWATNTTEYLYYKQKYLLYDKYWTLPSGPIFFYCGNEFNVNLYANHTGLMWETAKKLNALVVFAEHRFYGESLVLNNSNMTYLTHEQALADYARLITYLKETYNATNSPVIAFGGSYGGMLSAWFRIKYPSIVDGAISSSAPILMFPGQTPSYNQESYWQIVTKSASPSAGSSEYCIDNIKKFWNILFKLSKTSEGRQQLSSAFNLCHPITNDSNTTFWNSNTTFWNSNNTTWNSSIFFNQNSSNIPLWHYQIHSLSMFILMAFDTIAMGNYPYPSNYLTGKEEKMPAWPMRKSCSYLSSNIENELELINAISKAISVYHNVSKNIKCYILPTDNDYNGIWDYQWCTEMLPQETYFPTDGIHDMFWKRKIDEKLIEKHCMDIWKVKQRREWINISYGGYEELKHSSNIVFTNGLLDPWSSGGVLTSPSNTVIALTLSQGAHHLDLFFSHPQDPQELIDVRKIQIQHIKKWIQNANSGFHLSTSNTLFVFILFFFLYSFQ